MSQGKGTTKKTTHKSAKRTSAANKKSKGFTDVEKEAMKARAQELKAEERANKDREYGEKTVLAKIATMPERDRAMAKRIHAIVKASAPGLSPRLLVRHARVYQGRQGRLLFPKRAEVQDEVLDVRLPGLRPNLDEGALWPVSFALKELTPVEDARISALVKKAVG